jgi:hypothetical protein
MAKTRTFDRIKNYTTDVPVDRTIVEIERMLTKNGATSILKEYVGERPVGLSFIVNTSRGPMPVKMPVRVDKVKDVFKLQVSKGVLDRKYWGGEWGDAQAARVGWRILRDWLDAQLALINVEMSSMTEIFLPYVYSEKLGQTVYDMFESGQLNKMLAEHGTDAP